MISARLSPAVAISALNVEVETGRGPHPLEPDDRGVAELRLAEVVRHVHGEADRVVAGLAEPQLEERGEARGHLHGAEGRVVAGDEAGVGAVGGHPERTGVGHRHRDAVHAHGEAHAEGAHELGRRLHHAGPLVVGLGSDEEQEGHALLVDDAVEQQARVVVAAPVVAVEDHDRAAAAVVEQLVDVEGRDDARLVVLEEVVGHQALRVAGIDESTEGDDEHRGLQLLQHARRGVALELEELGRVLHGSGLSSSGIASCNALLHVKIPTPAGAAVPPLEIGHDRGQAPTLVIALSTRWGETL